MSTQQQQPAWRPALFWYDGVWYEEEPKILGPMDHAFWLGSVVFDGARAIRGRAPDLDRHCARLIASAQAMAMQPGLTATAITALCADGIRRLGPETELYIRPMFFVRRGLGAARPDPASTDFILALYHSPLPPWAGFSAILAPFRRPTPEMAPTDAKASCLYPIGALASAFAAAHGAEQAVMCDALGHVAEFATANLWFVSEGRVITPAVNRSFLNGITRQRLLALFREEGIAVEERTVRPAELDNAEEIFSSGNYAKILPCTRYNGRAMAIGPFATRARELYWRWVESLPPLA